MSDTRDRLEALLHERILVLDGGRIVESGTHAQLLRRSRGVYRRLYSLQFSEAES